MSLGEYVAFLLLIGLATAALLVGPRPVGQVPAHPGAARAPDDVLAQGAGAGPRPLEPGPRALAAGQHRAAPCGFRYGGPTSPAILEDVDLVFEPGTLTALVGRSGSGKTTLVKLPAGCLLPTEGTITSRRRRPDASRPSHAASPDGFVPQDTHLFDDSIEANIAYGEETPDTAAPGLAAERAVAPRVQIERFPLGFAPRWASRGWRSRAVSSASRSPARSTTTRRCSSSTRATSAWTPSPARRHAQPRFLLLADRTAVVIAHRLSTIRDAERIVVLDRGRVVEQARHDELVRLEACTTTSPASSSTSDALTRFRTGWLTDLFPVVRPGLASCSPDRSRPGTAGGQHHVRTRTRSSETSTTRRDRRLPSEGGKVHVVLIAHTPPRAAPRVPVRRGPSPSFRSAIRARRIAREIYNLLRRSPRESLPPAWRGLPS